MSLTKEEAAVDDDDADPMDYYEEYSEWLMSGRNSDLMICNGDSLVRHLESATRFDEFMEWRKK